MDRRAFLGLLALAPAATPAAGRAELFSGLFSDKYTWRQKLTVNVGTPDGIRTGAAVSEISITLRNRRGNRIAATRGEATVVAVAPTRYLFALLSGQLYYDLDVEQTGELAELLWREDLPDIRMRPIDDMDFDYRKEWGPAYAAIPRLKGAREMPEELWPTFATFADLADPRSVRVVKPDAMEDYFGLDVAIRSVSLEITAEPVTDGIVPSLLPWIDGWKDVLIPAPRKADGVYWPEERLRGINFRSDG